MRSCERLGGCSVSTIGKPHEYFDLTPTGNLRAPTMRVGKTLLVGFDESSYADVLG